MIFFQLLLDVLADLIRCNVARKDSDVCIEVTEGWSDFNCKKSKIYCSSENYAKDPRRCCPETCEVSEPFTKKKCLDSKRGGTCIYPFPSLPDECSEGMRSFIECFFVNQIFHNNILHLDYFHFSLIFFL